MTGHIEIVPVESLPKHSYTVLYRKDGIEYEFTTHGTGITNAAYNARMSLAKIGGRWEILSVTKQE